MLTRDEARRIAANVASYRSYCASLGPQVVKRRGERFTRTKDIGDGSWPSSFWLAERRRICILNDNEIRSLWEACTEVNDVYGALVKVALLTAQRRDKVATMRWDDLKGGEWTIRIDPREKGTAEKLKLPPMALEVIERQQRIAGNPYVFPARGKTAINSFSQRKDELDFEAPRYGAVGLS